MTPRWARLAWTLLTALALGAETGAAQAKVDGSSAYSKAQTYSGALRYVRVDLGYEVVEKDPDAAYLIFKYTTLGQPKSSSVTGTLEVIEADGAVKLFVSLPRLPEYHERVFRDGLLKKLRDEYGTPPPAKKPPAEKPPEKPAAPNP
ncbi:MAG TPA: hypothetical protein VJN18_16000 [Polyangiaceae bacterium]|nr:hypothetical protein [Polyangiaceae bacterium]